jgi:hypothetical protein
MISTNDETTSESASMVMANASAASINGMVPPRAHRIVQYKHRMFGGASSRLQRLAAALRLRTLPQAPLRWYERPLPVNDASHHFTGERGTVFDLYRSIRST